MKKVSKTQAKKEIEKFFSNVKSKSPKDIKKIKRFAMHHNIQLKDLRKKFCKKCFSPNLKTISTKNKVKRVFCEECGKVSRFKLKN